MKPTSLLLKSTFAIILCALISIAGYTQEVTREIQRTIATKPDMTLYLTNKQGDIHIDTWNKPEIRFTGTILLKGSNTDLLEKKLESMVIKISSDEKEIRIENQASSGNQVIWGTQPRNSPYFFNIQTFSGVSSEKTDFHITVPRNMKLHIDHQYGDVFVGNTDANVDLTLRHGTLKGEVMKGNNKLSLSYTDGTLKELGKATIEAQKCQLHIIGAGRLDIHSAYSEFEIDQADSLISSHKHNEFEIKNVGYLKMDENYSDVNVFHLFNEGDFRFNYGDLKLDWVAPDFKYLNLTGELSDFDVKLDTTATFSLEIDSDLTEFNLPDDLVIISKKNMAPFPSLRLQGVKGLESLKTIRYPENVQIKNKPKSIVIITKSGGVILK
ncbi:MAG: hypothetical protein R3D00_08020 [Bacteroidia bacterium]